MILTSFDVLYQHLSTETEENHYQTSVIITGLRFTYTKARTGATQWAVTLSYSKLNTLCQQFV